MKKLLLITFSILLITNCTYCMASTSDDLQAIETNIFGYDYSNETDGKRIERIEKHLYGEKKSGSIKQRLTNIQNDAGYTVVEKKAPEKLQLTPSGANQQPQTTASNNQPNQVQQQKAEKPDYTTALKEDSSVDYPMVDKLEQEIFSNTYKNENIYKRLDRLEQKVFNKVSDQDLNTRVDRLAAVVRPKKVKYNNSYNNYTSDDMDNYYSNSGLDPINNQSMPFQLAALEQDLLRNEYMNDNTASRLNRLEQKLFNRTFSTDSDITRLQRIMVAYDAKKNSYKYDNNRAMQNMATASQIGGILLMILAILL